MRVQVGINRKRYNMKFEDLKEYIDLYMQLGADYESAFMLALELMEV